jgi:hypothetical protein
MQKYFKSKFNKDKVPYLKEVFSLILLKVKKLEELLLLGKDHSNQTDVETSKSLVKPKRFSYNNLRPEQQVDQRSYALSLTSCQTY